MPSEQDPRGVMPPEGTMRGVRPVGNTISDSDVDSPRPMSPGQGAPFGGTIHDSPISPPGSGAIPSSPIPTSPSGAGFPQASGWQYKRILELGRGGMGAVHLAFDQKLRRHVAIKELLPELYGQERALHRFYNEATTIANLTHFHIVRIYGLELECVPPFLVMEYIPGPWPDLRSDWPTGLPSPPLTLADYVERAGSYKLPQAVDVCVKLLGAVGFAHDRGQIHRDIKPSNILLDESWEPKLVDFGLARPVGGSGLTEVGSRMLTVGYGAPEQERDASMVDHRADIYAVAATMYYLMTGESPSYFREGNIPESVRPIILTAMESNPDKRFQNAQAFSRALQTALSKPATSSRPSSNSDAGKVIMATATQVGKKLEKEAFDIATKGLAKARESASTTFEKLKKADFESDAKRVLSRATTNIEKQKSTVIAFLRKPEGYLLVGMVSAGLPYLVGCVAVLYVVNSLLLAIVIHGVFSPDRNVYTLGIPAATFVPTIVVTLLSMFTVGLLGGLRQRKLDSGKSATGGFMRLASALLIVPFVLAIFAIHHRMGNEELLLLTIGAGFLLGLITFLVLPGFVMRRLATLTPGTGSDPEREKKALSGLRRFGHSFALFLISGLLLEFSMTMLFRGDVYLPSVLRYGIFLLVAYTVLDRLGRRLPELIKALIFGFAFPLCWVFFHVAGAAFFWYIPFQFLLEISFFRFSIIMMAITIVGFLVFAVFRAWYLWSEKVAPAPPAVIPPEASAKQTV